MMMAMNKLIYIQPQFKRATNIYTRWFAVRGIRPEAEEITHDTKLDLPNAHEILTPSDIKEETRTLKTTSIGPAIFNRSVISAEDQLMKEPAVLPFDDVPGPKSLKYLSSCRHYMSQIGTQVTASLLTAGLDVGSLINRSPRLSALFDEYGPVVRFVSPVGGDIVLLNHPDHIQKVHVLEGSYPVRSTLDSLEKYRTEHRCQTFPGLYNVSGEEWSRQRTIVCVPLEVSFDRHLDDVCDLCETFAQKIYNIRNYQDEVIKDLYKEIHKWAFDCMGLLMFSKRFTMMNTELVYSQCDMSWLYHSLEHSTDAVCRCEAGLQLWKVFPTPAWKSLVKHCDALDNIIGKHVLEEEHKIAFMQQKESGDETGHSLIQAMLLSDDKMKREDIITVLMDMLLIGVNTVASTMSFLLYNLAKYQRVQKLLHQEIVAQESLDMKSVKSKTPYLQACIKETLRLVPPIPVLTRILPRNITLDKYNIPRGTLIIMSTQDASLKESNFSDATKFYPERWLETSSMDLHHAFASIPFGFGPRKCLGQNIAEYMISILTVRLIKQYKLEYYYGDIASTRTFLARPNKPLKLRFIEKYS